MSHAESLRRFRRGSAREDAPHDRVELRLQPADALAQGLLGQ